MFNFSSIIKVLGVLIVAVFVQSCNECQPNIITSSWLIVEFYDSTTGGISTKYNFSSVVGEGVDEPIWDVQGDRTEPLTGGSSRLYLPLNTDQDSTRFYFFDEPVYDTLSRDTTISVENDTTIVFGIDTITQLQDVLTVYYSVFTEVNPPSCDVYNQVNDIVLKESGTTFKGAYIGKDKIELLSPGAPEKDSANVIIYKYLTEE